MICKLYLAWSIVLEITSKIKNQARTNSEKRPATMSTKKNDLIITMQHNTLETRARPIKFADKSIDALKLSTLLVHI